MKQLFWNMGRNNNAGLALECMRSLEVGVAAFAECDCAVFSDSLLGDAGYRMLGLGGCDKIKVLAADSIGVVGCYEESRFSVFVLDSDEACFVFAAAHLTDRQSSSCPGRRIKEIGSMMGVVHGFETSYDIGKTIVIGDFNSNPYDEELLQPDAFNAVLFKGCLRSKTSRTWAGDTYPCLYNPTIHWLSEDTGNYGSFYYSSDDVGPMWNCFDQALVSPSLMDAVRGYRYLRKIGDTELIAKIAPKKGISDHLPLLLDVDLG